MKRSTVLFLSAAALLLSAPALSKAEASSVRIVGISAYDQHSTSSSDFVIDVVQGSCSASSTNPTAEPFSDTVLGVKVVNDSSLRVRFDRVRFTIRKIAGKRRFRSRRLATANIGEVLNDGNSKELLVLFAVAQNGTKLLPGSTTPIAADTGIRNVKLELRGVDAIGRPVSASAGFALAFRDVARCQ